MKTYEKYISSKKTLQKFQCFSIKSCLTSETAIFSKEFYRKCRYIPRVFCAQHQKYEFYWRNFTKNAIMHKYNIFSRLVARMSVRNFLLTRFDRNKWNSFECDNRYKYFHWNKNIPVLNGSKDKTGQLQWPLVLE